MPVPLAVVERHHTGSGFDEPASQQQALRNARGPVAVDEDVRVACAIACADSRVFFRDVKRLGQAGRCQKAHRLLGEMIDRVHCSGEVGVTTELVEASH